MLESLKWIIDMKKLTENANFTLRKYRDHKVAHVGIVSFLTNFTLTSDVDLLIMDTEGAEYDLLPLLANGGALDKHEIVICQVNVEVSPYAQNSPDIPP
ncbi:hypothetical protein Q1695_013033 [Nippostrongylus brasiliensis]|nr:hypothetical protein Q1695_013033 [Nippostrongylus brasiliensis]